MIACKYAFICFSDGDSVSLWNRELAKPLQTVTWMSLTALVQPIGHVSVVVVQLDRGVPGVSDDDVAARKHLPGCPVVGPALDQELIDLLPRLQGAVLLQLHSQRPALKGRFTALV